MLVSGGLFDRVQVLPLKVLDERELESLHVCSVFNYYRDLYDAGPLRRPPPSFTRDYLVPAPCLADDYRLNDAFLLNRSRELGNGVIVEIFPRLTRIGPDLMDADERKSRLSVLFRQQGIESSTQRSFFQLYPLRSLRLFPAQARYMSVLRSILHHRAKSVCRGSGIRRVSRSCR